MIEWDWDNIEDMVSYMNTELQKGRPQVDIEKNDFKVGERAIAKRFKRRGYSRIDNVWKFVGVAEKEPSHTKVIHKSPEVIENKVMQSTDVGYLIQDEDTYNNLVGLSKDYPRIKAMLEEYYRGYDKEYHNENEASPIKIKLPVEQENNFKTSIRINKVVWEQFDLFCKNNSEYTKRDLLSMALKEYMAKYSK